MKLVNVSRNIVLAEDITLVRGVLEKTEGLSGAATPHAIFFRTRWGIHTFGMRFPIDVVVMDNLYIVRKIKQNMRPNRFFFWNPAYWNVAELPPDTALPDVVMEGDTLVLTEEK